jgi:hypothetical protein
VEQVQDLLRDDPCVSAMVQFRGDTVGNAGGANKRKRSGDALASSEKKTPPFGQVTRPSLWMQFALLMLWFNTHEWKRSVNGMLPALTAESAGPRCQQVTLSSLSRPNVFDAVRIQMHRSQLRPCRYRIGWPLKDVAHFQKAILHIVP